MSLFLSFSSPDRRPISPEGSDLICESAPNMYSQASNTYDLADSMHDNRYEVMEEPPFDQHLGGSFPYKLYVMLEEIDAQGFAHVISWQPHGRCFIVHNRKLFVECVMPAYFRMSKFASFQRQLNLYGFNRITAGRDKRGYYHKLFLRGRLDLCNDFQRQKIKGTGVRRPSMPDKEPNFYLFPPIPMLASKKATHAPTQVQPQFMRDPSAHHHQQQLVSKTPAPVQGYSLVSMAASAPSQAFASMMQDSGSFTQMQSTSTPRSSYDGASHLQLCQPSNNNKQRFTYMSDPFEPSWLEVPQASMSPTQFQQQTQYEPFYDCMERSLDVVLGGVEAHKTPNFVGESRHFTMMDQPRQHIMSSCQQTRNWY